MVRMVLVILAVAIVSQFELFNISCSISAQTGCTPCYRPSSDPNEKIENKPANVAEVTLSTESLRLPCPPGFLPQPDTKPSSASMVVDVGVTGLDPEGDILTYNYTVSGGRIVGTGANVKWDLSMVAPGTYTITAGVDDGCGLCGKTQTKTVTVAESDCGGDCECASVEIAGPIDELLKVGENVFTANVAGGTYDPTYEWTVDGGEIAAGQGSPSITVKFDQKSLTAKTSVTVRIGGAPSSCACATEQTIEYVNGRRKP